MHAAVDFAFTWREVARDDAALLDFVNRALAHLAWPWPPPTTPECVSCFLARHGRLGWCVAHSCDGADLRERLRRTE